MSKQKIQLSDHFDYSRLIRFVLPCIGTMLFTSIYGIVDGLCVSNFVGKTAFAAVNLIMPVPMLPHFSAVHSNTDPVFSSDSPSLSKKSSAGRWPSLVS